MTGVRGPRGGCGLICRRRDRSPSRRRGRRAATVRRAGRRRVPTPLILVALGQQRPRLAFLQHREVQTEVLVVIVRRHVEPLRLQAEVRRREEPEILAARVPRRPHRVGQAVGDLLRLAGLDVADEDRVIQRLAAGSRTRPTSNRGSTPD